MYLHLPLLNTLSLQGLWNLGGVDLGGTWIPHLKRQKEKAATSAILLGHSWVVSFVGQERLPVSACPLTADLPGWTCSLGSTIISRQKRNPDLGLLSSVKPQVKELESPFHRHHLHCYKSIITFQRNLVNIHNTSNKNNQFLFGIINVKS